MDSCLRCIVCVYPYLIPCDFEFRGLTGARISISLRVGRPFLPSGRTSPHSDTPTHTVTQTIRTRAALLLSIAVPNHTSVPEFAFDFLTQQV